MHRKTMLRAARSWLWRLAVALLCAASIVLWPARGRAQNEPPPEDRGEGAVPRGGPGAAARPAAPQAPAQQPAVTLPEIVHFEQAPYPPEAEKAGVQGNVVLALTIDAEGNVTAAEVKEPAGHGFDEAAQAAAMKFKFKPATRDGKPIPAKILYRYSFTLTPVQPATPPPPPTTGNLGGELRIAGTDTPLVGAEVVVVGPDGRERRATTDAQGRWQLEGLPPGNYRVRVDAQGFVQASNVEQVVAGEATQATYRLAPKSEGLEVVVQGERPPREVTRRTIERREIERIPGTGGDALRSIQSLPGVARPPGLAGLLIVRGSAPQDTQTFVDGTNVPIIYHFGGLSSVVPTELLDRIDFYPGNFSARYGRVMGGIVDVGLREPDTHCVGDYGRPTEKNGCYHGMLQGDLIDVRALVQGPLGPFKDWSFAVGGRRSWVDAWIGPVLEEAGASVTTAPVYYDYQAIVETHPSRKSRLSLRGYGSDDRLELLVKDPFAQDPAFGGSLTFGTSFWRIQSLYEDELSPDVELTSMLAVGRDMANFQIGNFFFDIVAYPITMRSELGFKVSKGVKLDTGIDFLVAPFEFVGRFPQPPRPGEPDPGPFVTRPPLETRDEGTAYRPGWYVEAEIQPTHRLRVVPGMRFDYAHDSSQADFSPRINARYDIVSPTDDAGEDVPLEQRRLRTTIKGGVGLFHQPPDFGETDEVFGTPPEVRELRSNRAIHYSLGAEQEFTRYLELSVEGFYKDLNDLVSRRPLPSGGFEYANDDSGYVIGLETMLKYKPDKRFFGWLAYTLSRSVRTENGQERLFEFDQTHNFIVLGSYRLGRGWEFGARFRVVSGPLHTPVLSPPSLTSLYVADAGSYVPLQGEPFSQRLPLFHQLDVRIDKRWQFKDWRLSAYLDVQNIYNNPAVEAIIYNYDFSQHAYQTGLPILPSIGLRGEF
jgi:TonB family protein